MCIYECGERSCAVGRGLGKGVSGHRRAASTFDTIARILKKPPKEKQSRVLCAPMKRKSLMGNDKLQQCFSSHEREGVS